jgi:hypothetical protein
MAEPRRVRILDGAKTEIEKLLIRKADTQKRFAAELRSLDDAILKIVTRLYNAAAATAGAHPVTISEHQPRNAGLTTAVRNVLDSNVEKDFTAVEVRDALSEQGWYWKKYNNPLPTVHTTLMRLVKSKQAIALPQRPIRFCSAKSEHPAPQPPHRKRQRTS